MATSYVEFKDKGFWSVDVLISISGAYMYIEMQNFPEGLKYDWFNEHMKDIRLNSYGYFVGFTTLKLDDYLIDDIRVNLFKKVVQTTLNTLETKKGEILYLEELNKLVDHEGEKIWSDRWVYKSKVVATLGYILKILNGEDVVDHPRF